MVPSIVFVSVDFRYSVFFSKTFELIFEKKALIKSLWLVGWNFFQAHKNVQFYYRISSYNRGNTVGKIVRVRNFGKAYLWLQEFCERKFLDNTDKQTKIEKKAFKSYSSLIGVIAYLIALTAQFYKRKIK